ncbi:hypothetical protein [Mesomycoplasma ovipneumoniae]|nr:hypothetical protein [Mesomycoplasma ovipneumoniae]WNM14774.1 hypothetical protein RNM01_03460 [Mesomycoplasma ovipneumoniae]
MKKPKRNDRAEKFLKRSNNLHTTVQRTERHKEEPEKLTPIN